MRMTVDDGRGTEKGDRKRGQKKGTEKGDRKRGQGRERLGTRRD